MRGRYKPFEALRAFGDQIEQLCEETGLLKWEIAEKASISPSQLAHYLKFGTSTSMIERISHAVGIQPEYFDVYVAEIAPEIIGSYPELMRFIREFRAASAAKRREMLKRLP